jgi:hypothetical protein
MGRRAGVASVTAAALLVGAWPTVPVAAAGSLVLSAVVEREANYDAHAFELYGTFDDPRTLRPEVECDGRPTAAAIMAPPGGGQVNVNVAAMPGGSTCRFTLVRVTDNQRSATLTDVTTRPPIQIDGIADAGVTGGRRFVELYGQFANAARLDPRVLCSGRYVGARTEFASAGQVNISMPNAGTASTCSYELRDRVTLLGSPRFGAPAPDLPPSARLRGFGAYFWGGAAGPLPGGQRALDRAGFTATRLTLTPRMRNGDPVENHFRLDLAALDAACPASVPFLPCVVRQDPVQQAISAASLDTIVLTAYDSATSGSHGQSGAYVDEALMQDPTLQAAVRREYRQLAYALHQTQAGTGKTFVIASWEGDNQAYCGSFFGYWSDPAFRASCGTIASRTDAVDAMRIWFRLRAEGLQSGRKLALADGYSGVRVASGVEFNINTYAYSYQVGGTTLPSILMDVVPDLDPAYVLYSSYDSQNRGRMELDLDAIQAWLVGVAPGSKLAIGEVAFPEIAVDERDIFRTVETAKAIQRARVAFAILWEGYDTVAGDRVQQFGVLNANGSPRLVQQVLRHELLAQADELRVPTDITVNGITDRLVSDVGGTPYRFYELYGSFPGAGYTATAVCDGIGTAVDIVFAGPGQINVRIPHQYTRRFCSLRLARPGAQPSRTIGPVAACAEPTLAGPCF